MRTKAIRAGRLGSAPRKDPDPGPDTMHPTPSPPAAGPRARIHQHPRGSRLPAAGPSPVRQRAGPSPARHTRPTLMAHPASSLYGQSLAVPSAPTAPLVLTAFEFSSSWGFSLRTPRVQPGITGHGRWTDAAGLLTADWMSPGPAAASGAPRSYAQSGALACLLSLHGASRRAN